MLKLIKIASISLMLVLTGCASTVKSSGDVSNLSTAPVNAQKIVMTVKGADAITKNTDWDQMREEWDVQMREVTKIAGIDYRYSKGAIAPEAGNNGGTRIDIKVNDYRYVSAAARFFAGIMTGNAWLDVDVEYRDLGTGNLVFTRNYQTKSTAWQGAFSAMTPKQVASVCNEIVQEISKHKTTTNASAVIAPIADQH